MTPGTGQQPDVLIVVAAHGPAQTTDRALQAARDLPGSRVIAYPAVRAGARVSAPEGVETVDAVARHGLLAALDDAREPFVIHVHDDVLLTPETAMALVRASEGSGSLTVPWSNDLGTDHFAGSLPTVSEAGRVIGERRASTGHSRVVQQVRPCCVAGTPGQIRGLVPLHLAYPGTRLNTVKGDIEVVHGALVAHDDTCITRLEPPEGPEDRPLLVAAMIVRDEEQMLPGCLDSLEGVVDRIEVCDTGSVDRTVEIAEQRGAVISRRDWRDDFAWARNQVLERCRDAWWVLSIDADERLQINDITAFRRLLATAVDEFDVISIPIDDSPDMASPTAAWWYSPRILSPTAACWQGALHERVVARERPLSTTSVEEARIRHLGYGDQIISAKDKISRNLDIARRAFEEDPNGDNALHFARSLDLAGHPAHERIEPLEIADEKSRGSDSASRAFVKAHLAHALLEDGQIERAMATAADALELVPAEDNAAVIYVRAALRLGRYEDILSMNEQRRSTPSLSPAMVLASRQAAVESTDVEALIGLDRAEEAWATARRILEQYPAGFAAWEALVDLVRSASDPHRELRRLLDLALLSDDGTVFRFLGSKVKPELLAMFVADYFDRGGRNTDALQIGIMAAVLKERWEVFERLCHHADQLPEVRRHALATRLSELGHAQRAAQLTPQLPGHRPFRI